MVMIINTVVVMEVVARTMVTGKNGTSDAHHCLVSSQLPKYLVANVFIFLAMAMEAVVATAAVVMAVEVVVTECLTLELVYTSRIGVCDLKTSRLFSHWLTLFLDRP